MQNKHFTDYEALSIEAVQALQDVQAVAQRLTGIIEKMALMQRDRLIAMDALDGLRSGSITVAEAVTQMGGKLDEGDLRAWIMGDEKREPAAGEPLDRQDGEVKTYPVDAPERRKTGGYTHGRRQEVKLEIDCRGEMPDRTDMASEPEPKDLPVSKGDHLRTDMPEPEDAPSVRAMTQEKHAEKHGAAADTQTAGDPPVAKPPIGPRMYDRILDHYAEHGGGNAAIAKACDSTPNSVATYLRTARLNGDSRVARGDLKRQQGEEAPLRADDKPDPKAAYRRETQPKTVEPMETRIGKDAIIRVFDDTKMVDGPDDEVPIRSPAWRDILKAMAHQQPMSEATVLKMLGKGFPADTVWDEIKRTNLSLAKTGLVIHSIDGGPVYQLRKLI